MECSISSSLPSASTLSYYFGLVSVLLMSFSICFSMLYSKMENSLITGSFLYSLYWQPKYSKNIVCVWAQNGAVLTNTLNSPSFLPI